MVEDIELIQIHIRMMESEKNKLKAEAEKVKMTLQDYCWHKLLTDPDKFKQIQQLLTREDKQTK